MLLNFFIQKPFPILLSFSDQLIILFKWLAKQTKEKKNKQNTEPLQTLIV